jgi:hypothetical protein
VLQWKQQLSCHAYVGNLANLPLAHLVVLSVGILSASAEIKGVCDAVPTIVMLGPYSSGKSSAASLILGQEGAFKAEYSFDGGVTMECTLKKAKILAFYNQIVDAIKKK